MAGGPIEIGSRRGPALKPDSGPLEHPPPLSLQREQETRLLQAWRIPEGWRYWTEVNNSVVGSWYTAVTVFFLLFGGVLALLMRIQLAYPDNTFLSAEKYNQIFTVHGSVMMFLFAIPIFEAISILFLPQMLGARDLPFPRLSSYGFWAFLIGGVFLCGSIFFDAAPNGGWFMYPPLTSKYEPGIGADMWLLGFSFIEVAAIAASVELIVGVLKSRPPGMRINLIPLYAWYVLVAAIMVLFAFPPLIAGSLLLELERAFQWPFFDPTRGGDPLLWQHLFWLFGHPEFPLLGPAVPLLGCAPGLRTARTQRHQEPDGAGRYSDRAKNLPKTLWSWQGAGHASKPPDSGSKVSRSDKRFGRFRIRIVS